MVLNAIRHPYYKSIYSKIINNSSVWGLISDLNKRYYVNKFGESPQHASAKKLEKSIPEWSNYTKFCVVRNPWDKTVSDYLWRTRSMVSPPNFDEYLSNLFRGKDLNGIIPNNHDNWNMYTIKDKVCIDNVVRFENLSSDLDRVLNSQLGIGWDGWLPHAKKMNKKIRPSYRKFYNKEQSQMLYDFYSKEINYFGYEF